MIQTFSFSTAEIKPYINWNYFFHAWQLKNPQKRLVNATSRNDSQDEETIAGRLYDEALEWLEHDGGTFTSQVRLGLFEANAEGDDIIVHSHRVVHIPMLRQQHPERGGTVHYCLADFIRPTNKENRRDRIGVFAATSSPIRLISPQEDPYGSLMQQTLCDRLAEAAIEKMHEDVRKKIWGYVPNENLSIAEMHAVRFQGIRPAVGYPSMPDQSVNFILDELIDFGSIHVELTENGAMYPHSSVSGLIIAHPKAHYFSIGKIGNDQLQDYARRRGMEVDKMSHFLSANLTDARQYAQND